jgi:hypothetical protein
MNSRTPYRANARPVAIAVAMPHLPALDLASLRDKLSAVRGAIALLTMHVLFRVIVLMRQLNY